METETENKEHQRKNSISSLSSSRCSSITSDSSDGHFDIRHFPLPKPSLSASEAQKIRETHQAYNSSVSSYGTGSSWSSIRQNHLNDLPGYDPNRIPSSVFSSKPGNSTEWSIASNESLFSIHDGNFNISTSKDHGLAALAEIPRFEDTVHEITEINPLPPVKIPNESEKETIAEEEPYQVEILDSEIDDCEKEEKTGEVESDDEEEEEMIETEVLVETEEKEVVKEIKPEDSNSVVSHSPSISCRSDTSNNSIGSFVFPLLRKEDAVMKTPSIEIRGNLSHKRRPEYQLPQSPVLPPQPQPQQPYSESSTLTDLQPQSQPQLQRKTSKMFESRTQSRKASSIGWFSCFHCPSKCSLFK